MVDWKDSLKIVPLKRAPPDAFSPPIYLLDIYSCGKKAKNQCWVDSREGEQTTTHCSIVSNLESPAERVSWIWLDPWFMGCSLSNVGLWLFCLKFFKSNIKKATESAGFSTVLRAFAF